MTGTDLAARLAAISAVPREQRRVGKPWWCEAAVLYAEGRNANEIAKELRVFRGSVVHALKTMDLWQKVPR